MRTTFVLALLTGVLAHAQTTTTLLGTVSDKSGGVVPDATVTALSSNATRFSEVETNAACGFTLAVAGDGFSGETTVSGCTLALRGGTGKWSIDMEPGSIRLRNVASGETLRFRREGK